MRSPWDIPHIRMISICLSQLDILHLSHITYKYQVKEYIETISFVVFLFLQFVLCSPQSCEVSYICCDSHISELHIWHQTWSFQIFSNKILILSETSVIFIVIEIILQLFEFMSHISFHFFVSLKDECVDDYITQVRFLQSHQIFFALSDI